MWLAPVTEEEVAGVFRDMKPKHSADMYGVSAWLLKQCFHNLLKPLTKLINLSFESGHFPSMMKKSKVIPIFKKGETDLLNNYRPVSILPIFSKVFEKLFLIRLLSFLERFEILNKEQFGFRKGRNTIEAVTQLVDTVIEGLERREACISVFLDLSKAFDCVNHKILISKLHNSGIRGIPLLWLESYLHNRSQQVQINAFLSRSLIIEQGVPQGSILGPVLFLLYVNNLKSSLTWGRLVQFADDTNIIFRGVSNESLEIQGFIDLNVILQILLGIQLKINESKSNYIFFTGRRAPRECSPSVILNETEIDEVNETKFLGMHLDRGLTWNAHVEVVCAKISSGIYALRNLSQFCNTHLLKMAYYGLIYPHLSYGITLWGGCARYNFFRCFILQKKAVRIIAKLRGRDSCRESFKTLDLLTLPSIYITETIQFCKKKCTLIRGTNVHEHNTRGRNLFRTAQHRLRAYDALPSEVGAKLINKLPDNIRNEQSETLFKGKLRRFLVEGAFYNVSEYLERTAY